MSLFDSQLSDRLTERAPLGERLRPRKLSEIVGQDHLLGERGALGRMVSNGRLVSMILWGPPGVGKTTIARLVAREAGYEFMSLSAAGAGVKEVREAIESAKRTLGENGRASVVFIDEIHRFNKSQQDMLLGSVESGVIVLVGATTENPYFEVNSALLSRVSLWRLNELNDEAIGELIERAKALLKIEVEAAAKDLLIRLGSGDARVTLGTLEAASVVGRDGIVSAEDVLAVRPERIVAQSEDSHYDQTSAMIKSIRGSDPNAGLYWMASLLAGGESARYVARRLVILASEDVGLADLMGLVVAEAGARAIEMIGMPEAQLILGQVVVYLALAAKSNSITTGVSRANRLVGERAGSVPRHLRDGHYAGAKALGVEGYLYPHDFGGFVEQQYLPDELLGTRIFNANIAGVEENLVKSWRERTGKAG